MTEDELVRAGERLDAAAMNAAALITLLESYARGLEQMVKAPPMHVANVITIKAAIGEARLGWKAATRQDEPARRAV